MRFARLLFVAVIVASIALLAVSPTLAQCAMCKAAVEGSTDAEAASRGLNLAALVLLIPPVTIFAGMFGAIYRYRNVQGRKD